ncbi:MAG TPA: DUF3037 domain-containing protein [Gemmatimonadaceae bacterium]|nr:DUF3037 domain-containing protein [Gemmatimonadaceae bacterium]
MTAKHGWIAYDFAVLRVVPHVHIGAFVPVGVVLHARTAEFLGMRVITDVAELASTTREVDTELLSRYLKSCELICAGDASAGPIALAPPSERFHWLTAPRSDVIQCGPVHGGLCEVPSTTLDDLFESVVRTNLRTTS